MYSVAIGGNKRAYIGSLVSVGDAMTGKRLPTYSRKAPKPLLPIRIPGPTRKEVIDHPDYKEFLKKLAKIPGPTITLANEVDDTPSPPITFEFIDEMRLGKDVPDFDRGFQIGCDCKDGCTDSAECQCLEGHDNVYNKHGRIPNA